MRLREGRVTRGLGGEWRVQRRTRGSSSLQAAEFDAEDRFDAGFFGGEDELDDAVEVAGIGDSDGWAMVLGGQVDDVFRREVESRKE